MPGARLEPDDEIAIVGELARAVAARERRKLQPRRELDQHVLPRPHVAIERHDRMPDRIGGRIGLGDRPIEQRYRVVALEVRRVGQHEIGERHRLRRERVDRRRRTESGTSPSSFCAHSMSRVPAVFIAEFHAMLAMNSSSVSIGYGSPATALAITMCIRPCAAIGDSHEYALSIRSGTPSLVDREILGAHRKAERRARERLVRRDAPDRRGKLLRRDRLRIRRACAEVARAVQRAEQHLQQMQRAARLEAVRVRRDAAHRVHRDRPPDDLVVMRDPTRRSSAIGSSTLSSNATCAISRASRSIVSAATPQRSATAAGA